MLHLKMSMILFSSSKFQITTFLFKTNKMVKLEQIYTLRVAIFGALLSFSELRLLSYWVRKISKNIVCLFFLQYDLKKLKMDSTLRKLKCDIHKLRKNWFNIENFRLKFKRDSLYWHSKSQHTCKSERFLYWIFKFSYKSFNIQKFCKQSIKKIEGGGGEWDEWNWKTIQYLVDFDFTFSFRV